jgi:putative flippase GtrA
MSKNQTNKWGELPLSSLTKKRFRTLFQRTETRYLVVGGMNTALSFCLGPILFYFLIDHIHYIFIMILGAILNVTISYLNYKFFVFQTKSNYIREYLRFYLVYAVPIGFNFVAFPFCYQILRMNPYLAQIMLSMITVIFSYFGHKNFSFSTKRRVKPPESNSTKTSEGEIKI